MQITRRNENGKLLSFTVEYLRKFADYFAMLDIDRANSPAFMHYTPLQILFNQLGVLPLTFKNAFTVEAMSSYDEYMFAYYRIWSAIRRPFLCQNTCLQVFRRKSNFAFIIVRTSLFFVDFISGIPFGEMR